MKAEYTSYQQEQQTRLIDQMQREYTIIQQQQ